MRRLSQTWKQKRSTSTSSSSVLKERNQSEDIKCQNSDFNFKTPTCLPRLRKSGSSDNPGSGLVQSGEKKKAQEVTTVEECLLSSSLGHGSSNLSPGFEFDAAALLEVDRIERNCYSPIQTKERDSHPSSNNVDDALHCQSIPICFVKDTENSTSFSDQQAGSPYIAKGSVRRRGRISTPIEDLNHVLISPSAGSPAFSPVAAVFNDLPVNQSACDIAIDTSTSSVVEDPLKTSGSCSTIDCNPSGSNMLSLGSWGLPPSVLHSYRESGITHMFEWQVECLRTGNVLKGGNLVYTAPTSAGKTMVAELLVLKRVLETKRKALFILPFVSVAREKMFYLQRLFQEAGVRVEGYMGSHAPAGGFAGVDVAVCTIEKANSLVNRLMEEGKMATLGAVVVDELHLIGDPGRGYLLELLLTKIRYISSKPCIQGNKIDTTDAIQIVGMSATLPNLNLLARWLSADLYCTDHRPVPLTEMIKVSGAVYDGTMTKIRDLDPSAMIGGDDDHVILLCKETISGGHSVLIFCPTKNWCEKLAETIARHFASIGSLGLVSGNKENQEKPGFVKASSLVKFDRIAICEVLEQLRRTPVGVDSVLARTVPHGVAYHHAGLTFDERDIIEGGFRQGAIKVLIATSTLSSGVNLPARRVIIRTPMFHGKLVDALVYKQMAGRAGRKGVDTQGESILICKPAERQKAANLLTSQLKPVKSCLFGDGSERSSIKRALLEVIVSGVASRPQDVERYAACTFSAAGQTEQDSTQGEALIPSTIRFLVEHEFIRLQPCESKKQENREGNEPGLTTFEERYVPTQLGMATLASALSPGEALAVFAELQKARKCFVLENELHILYQVTPIYIQSQLPNIDWYQYLRIWEHLPSHMRRVSDLVGVEEAFLARAVRGRIPTRTEQQRISLAIHRRFFAALALHDLVHEVPLPAVARRYGATKGMLQSLQGSAATFAGMVTIFCQKLGWSNLELLVSQFQSRLSFGVERELCDLVRISVLNAARARMLYNAGYHTIAALASAAHGEVEQILRNAVPFTSGRRINGETEFEIRERNRGRVIWVAGRRGLTEGDAAKLIVKEAKELLQKDVAQLGIQWKPSEAVEHTADNSSVSSNSSTIGNRSSSIREDTSYGRGGTNSSIKRRKPKSGNTSRISTRRKRSPHMKLNALSSNVAASAETRSTDRPTSGKAGSTSSLTDACRDKNTKVGRISINQKCEEVKSEHHNAADNAADNAVSIQDPRFLLNGLSNFVETASKAVSEVLCETEVRQEAEHGDVGSCASAETAETALKEERDKFIGKNLNRASKLETAKVDKTGNIENLEGMEVKDCSDRRVDDNLHTAEQRQGTAELRSWASGTCVCRRGTTSKLGVVQDDCSSTPPDPALQRNKRRSPAVEVFEDPIIDRPKQKQPRTENSEETKYVLQDSTVRRPNFTCQESQRYEAKVNETNEPLGNEGRNQETINNQARGSEKEVITLMDETPSFEVSCSSSLLFDITSNTSTISNACKKEAGPSTSVELYSEPFEGEEDVVHGFQTNQATEEIPAVPQSQGPVCSLSDTCLVAQYNLVTNGLQTVSSVLISPRLEAVTDEDDDIIGECQTQPRFQSSEGFRTPYQSQSPCPTSFQAMTPTETWANLCSPNRDCVTSYQPLPLTPCGKTKKVVVPRSDVEMESFSLHLSFTEGCGEESQISLNTLAMVEMMEQQAAEQGGDSPEKQGNSINENRLECKVELQDRMNSMNTAEDKERRFTNIVPKPITHSIRNKTADHEMNNQPTRSSRKRRSTESNERAKDDKTGDANLVSLVSLQNMSKETRVGDAETPDEGTDTPDLIPSTPPRTRPSVGRGMTPRRTPRNQKQMPPPASSPRHTECIQRSPHGHRPRPANFKISAPCATSSRSRTNGPSQSTTPPLGDSNSRPFDTTNGSIQDATSGLRRSPRGQQPRLAAAQGFSTSHCREARGTPPRPPQSQSTAPNVSTTHSFSSDDSVSIIDVAGHKRLFDTFMTEWKAQPRFALAVACERLPGSAPTIGARFNTAAGSSESSSRGLKVGEEDATVVGLAVSWGKKDAYYLSLLDPGQVPDAERIASSQEEAAVATNLPLTDRLEAIKPLLESKQQHLVKICFDVKENAKVLARACGVSLAGKLHDPKVASWLLDPGAKEKTFQQLVVQHMADYSGLLEGTGGGVGAGSLGLASTSPVSGRMRACTEVVVVFGLMEQLWTAMAAESLETPFEKVEVPSLLCLARMELNGFGFSEVECERLKSILQAKLRSLEEEAYRLANHSFSLTCPQDVAQVLFIELKLPPDGNPENPPPQTKRRPLGVTSRSVGRRGRNRHLKHLSTNKDVLEKLKNLHPLPRLILEWRRVNSALSKVVFPLQREKHPCSELNMSRIHSVSQTHTATGRVSFTEPNLQNVPKDFEIDLPTVITESPPPGTGIELSTGRSRRKGLRSGFTPIKPKAPSSAAPATGPAYSVSMRNAFIPFEQGVLLAADYSQLELRLIAHLSEDQRLQKVLNSGGDVFRMIAGEMACAPVEMVTDQQRQWAKQICYGMVYGIGAKALGEQLGIGEDDASVFMETFKAKYSGIRKYLKKTVEFCKQNGFVKTLMGRKRFLPSIHSTNVHARSQAERQAVNTTVQGSAADLVKIAMINIDHRLAQAFPSCATPHRHKRWTEGRVSSETPSKRQRSRQKGKRGSPNGGYFVLQLHDELIYEVAVGDLKRVAEIVQQEMEKAVTLSVVLPVKLKAGPSWGNMSPFEL